MSQLTPDLLWFLAMSVFAALSWAAGIVYGRRYPDHLGVAIAVSVALLVCATYLSRHPAVAVQVIPVDVLRQIEGSVAVPFFLFIVGLILARAQLPRQRRVAGWATLLGVVYFIQGSFWLLQPTPQVGFARSAGSGAVLQSADYSCVPAACATTLNLLGHPTSEAEMVHLTATRPGVGSTTVRALHGLNQRLDNLRAPGHFYLLPASPESLRVMPLPALTALRFERTRRHMVTLVETDRFGVVIEDPIDGRIHLAWGEFAQYYNGEIILYATR